MTKTLLSPRLFSFFSLFILTGFFPFFSNENVDAPIKSDLTSEVSTVHKKTDPTPTDYRFSDFFFIENKGQWEENILYKLDMPSAKLFVEKNRLNFLLINPDDLAERSHRHAHHGEHDHEAPVPIHCHRFYIDFVGASPTVGKSATKKLTPYYNYLIGNDLTKHASYVGLYEEVFYENLYSGIDLRLYNRGANLKYDYLVEAGADPNQIMTKYSYADKVFLKEGKLHIQTSVNEIVEQEPYAFQEKNGERIEVACDFKLENNQLSFVFPEGYDNSLPLVIDPELVFASYSGAGGDNWGNTATYDDDGNLYGGSLAFDDYPTTSGAFIRTQPGDGGFFDNDPGTMAITKFSEDGTSMIYSTFLGGDETEIPHSMIVNSQNQLVILGTTSSNNFPIVGGFDNSFGGGASLTSPFNDVNGIPFNDGSDIVVSVLNTTGTGLIGSTFIGGSENDGLHLLSTGVNLNYSDQLRGEVILDDADNIYVASTTYSTNFPTSSNAFQSSHGGGDEDAVIFKLSPNTSDLIWSSYYGGNGVDAAYSLKVDNFGNTSFVGATSSSNLPTSSNAIQPSNGSNSSGYVSQIRSDGSALNAGSYLSDGDFAYFIELDAAGDVYVIGQDRGRSYPIEGAVYSNDSGATFLHKLNSDFSQTLFSTQLGTSRTNGILVPSAFLVDFCNRIYISGWGGATNAGQNISGMPVSTDALQPTTDGSDFYLMVLTPGAKNLEYASYFGGRNSDEHVDGGTSRFDKKGIIYQAVCAGCGGFDDFPTTPGAVSNRNGSSNCNLGVFKLDFQLDEIRASALAGPETSGCAPLEVNFNNFSTGATIFDWDFGNGDISDERNPIYTFQQPGSYLVRMIGSIEADCIDPDTVYLTIEAFPSQPGDNTILEICEGSPMNIASSVTDANTSFTWNTGATSSDIDISTGGVFWVDATLTTGACPQRDSFFVNALPNGVNTQTLGICEGQIRMLESRNQFPAVDYLWQDGSIDRTFEIDDIGTYWVVAERSGCQQIDTFFITPDSITLDLMVLDIDCIGQDSGFISAQVTGGTPDYEYSLNQEDFGLENSFDNLAPGTYRMEARDVNGCIDVASVVIDLPPAVTVQLDQDRTICLGDSIDIEAQVALLPTEVEEVVWSEFIKPDCPTCLEQNVRPLNTTTYAVWVKSTDGCAGLDSITIKVEPKRPLFVPAAFSPNNDGINDEFVIYSKPGLVAAVHLFQVYDRWGNLIFEQKNFQPNDPAFGWDGMFRGKRMDPAVFAWHAEVEFIDGYMDQVEGDVTLVFGR